MRFDAWLVTAEREEAERALARIDARGAGSYLSDQTYLPCFDVLRRQEREGGAALELVRAPSGVGLTSVPVLELRETRVDGRIFSVRIRADEVRSLARALSRIDDERGERRRASEERAA